MKSFINPLLEETHADLLSSMTMLSHPPTCEIFNVKHLKSSTYWRYMVSLKRKGNGGTSYEPYKPAVGDLIALTDVKAKRTADLKRPKWPYVVALVQGSRSRSNNKCFILSSKPIIFDKGRERLFAVSLTNLTTNSRIWDSLHLGSGNMNIIREVLQIDHVVRFYHISYLICKVLVAYIHLY